MQPRVDRHRLTFVLLAWLGGATVCFAQDVARMDQVVQSYVSNGTFAGSVLVARGSDVIVSKGYGLANVEWNVPSSPSARFKVASITKQFTAAAILLLEERGRLKIDDLVKTHLPEAPATWDRMTLFHLLTHTAGFPGLQSPPTGRQAPVESADGTVAGFVTALDAAATRVAAGRAFQLHELGLLRPRSPYSEAHREVLRDVPPREHLHAAWHERLGARQPQCDRAPRRVTP